MRAIILAAGEGQRLRPYTETRPKCMVPVLGRPIIDHIVDTLEAVGIDDIVVVGGYRQEVLQRHLAHRGLRHYRNPDYDSTNMVSTLFCAEEVFEGDVLISYADIVYEPRLVQALLADSGPLSIIVDRAWRPLWEMRMDDPLLDAETMKVNADGLVVELGKKPRSLEEVQGQYIGLLRMSSEGVTCARDFYRNMDRGQLYDGKDFSNMYMTSFLQGLINQGLPSRAVWVDGGWIEVDTVQDLEVYEAAGEGVFKRCPPP